MSFSYVCNFQTQATRLTPVAKRQGVRLGFLECISEPIQWNHTNFFDYYLNGDDSDVWDIGTGYIRGDRVNYQNKIYECIAPDDANGDPIVITGELPTTDFWEFVVNDFRGVTERIKYNSQRLMMEWVLNKWFDTLFVQPNIGGTRSDFYIITNDRNAPTFTVPEDSVRDGMFVSNSIPEDAVKVTMFVKDAPNYSTSANFTVYYPLTTIADPSDPEYFQMVALVNKYKVIGSTVEYISY